MVPNKGKLLLSLFFLITSRHTPFYFSISIKCNFYFVDHLILIKWGYPNYFLLLRSEERHIERVLNLKWNDRSCLVTVVQQEILLGVDNALGRSLGSNFSITGILRSWCTHGNEFHIPRLCRSRSFFLLNIWHFLLDITEFYLLTLEFMRIIWQVTG